MTASERRRRNAVRRFQKGSITEWLVLFLVFLLFSGSPPLFPREAQGDSLEKLFQWTKMDYLEGNYREAITNLKLLLSYCEDEDENALLKGKIYLLLGATYEKSGRIRKARENYRLCSEILGNQDREIKIEGVDLNYLPEYQRIIEKKDRPVQQGIIERPASKRKKKGLSPLLVIAAAAVTGVAVALLLLKKKKTPPGIDADYDTRELGIEWVEVSQGSFWMGDNFNEGDEDELPLHNVYLDTYYISRYEVTFAQYDKFCDETGRLKPSDQGWGRGDLPAIYVAWGDADAFCQWLSQKTGKDIRLPTEAQWEKAARGTNQRRYPWGDEPPDCSKTNYNCDNRTHAVGSHSPGISNYGIHDLAGNVSEWCRDFYFSNYYGSSPYSNPLYTLNVISSGSSFVIRGGSWDSSEDIGIRSTDRGYRYHYTKLPTVGFRPVLIAR